MVLTFEFDLNNASMPNIWVKDSLVQKLLSEHTNRADCAPPGTLKWSVNIINNKN